MEAASANLHKTLHIMLWNIGLLLYDVPYMPHMTKMDSLVSKSIEALDATGKQSTVFFILYVHKMYSPSLGIKLQEEVTYCISYISEKSVHRLFIQFMVIILPVPTRHITNYDRQHLVRHMYDLMIKPVTLYLF